MFIQDTDLIEIKIYYRKKNFRYEAYTQKEADALSEEEKKKLILLSLKMKELTWGLHNQLQEDALQDSGKSDGERLFNYKLYKESRLKALVKEWDAKDKNGKVVTINDQAILSLSPSVAETILRAYDEASMIGDDEEKK